MYMPATRLYSTPTSLAKSWRNYIPRICA